MHEHFSTSKLVIACAFINYIIKKLAHAQTVDTRLSFSPSKKGKKRLGTRLMQVVMVNHKVLVLHGQSF